MKTLSERNRILNEVKDSCYLAFFDGNPEEGGKEILTGRKKVNFPVATNGYVKSTNQLDFTGGEEATIAYGDTSQKAYTGKNLLDIFSTPSWTGANTVYTPDNDELTVDGKWFVGFTIPVEQNTRYYFSAVRKNSSGTGTVGQVRIYTRVNGNIVADFGTSNGYFDSGTNTTLIVLFYSSSGEYGKCTFVKPQVEKGSSATDYEPYVGGIPAPNPDYPQEIENVVIGNLELCKIVNHDNVEYQDSVYTENGKWYKHANIGKVDLKTGITYIRANSPATGTGYSAFQPSSYTLPNGKSGAAKIYNKYFIHTQRDNVTSEPKTHCYTFFGSAGIKFFVPDEIASSVQEWSDWLNSVASFETYYILNSATDTEITDQTTIAALEEMFGNATGVAKYWGIYDSEVGGELLYYFVMPYEVNIVKDSTITINAGNCVLKEG